MSEQAFLAAITEEITRRRHEEVQVVLDVPAAFQIIAALQLACRHPGVLGETRATVERLTRELANRIAPDPKSSLRQLIEMGWNPEHDQ